MTERRGDAESMQSGTVEFLSNPKSYPDRPGGVEHLQTHISHIFLAGGHGYKLKRAVTLPFLDFGTLEQRHEACLNELRVNRRSAPEIYEDVVPVTRRSDGGLEIGGRGEVVDWVVRMRRFSQDALYDRMAEKGQLGPERMEPLAEAIFTLHGLAERDLTRNRPVAELEQIIGDNGAALSDRSGICDPGDADELTKRSLDRLETLAPLLRQRTQTGCVRHCHGDLHLRNIVDIDGRPVLFDAIEFDDGLATIDVLYDLGFLLMDLWRRGLRFHANRVHNAYLEREAGTMNLPGLAALPLFLSVRAMIRCKVKALEDDDSGTAAGEAREYFSLARGLLEPAPATLAAI
ncbi:MAG: phosphotransferase, partial [Hyphomicrobiales bacterium]